jgi:hypothetical protein
MSEETKIHFILNFDDSAAVCGAKVDPSFHGGVAFLWPGRVTCPACRLEMPEDKTGRPEYRIPADVLERDRLLALADARAARLASQLARADELLDECVAEVTHWSRLLKEAASLRSRLLAAQNGSVVGQVGIEVQKGAERAEWMAYLDGIAFPDGR